MSHTTEIHGLDTGPYASAHFQDAEDESPMAAFLDMGGHIQSAPFSIAMNSMLSKQIDEIKIKTTVELNFGLPTVWKRRLRDFMVKKNTDLLDFMKVTVEHHPALGPAETLLRRFGNPQVTPTHPSVKDMVLDVSGVSPIDDINAALRALSTGTPLNDYEVHTRAMYDMYMHAGDDALKAQQALQRKLDKLDRIQGKISSLFDIEPNELYQPLMESTEAYIKKIYEDNQISQEYANVIAAYRRFIALRDIVSMSRALLSHESEPLCSICLDETVTYAISPCGHTLCQTCMRRQSASCFMCRSPIKDKLKLYFG